MKTTFSKSRMEFTKRAHLAAQSQFYPELFGGLPLTFEDTVGTVKDLEYAIDCRVAVSVKGFKAPLYFAVQERWRDPAEMHWGDVTITEWNRATNQPSELHKLGAQLFVYGFYEDLPTNRIVLAVALDVAVVLRRLALRQLKWTRQSRIDQTFLGFSFRDLDTIGAVLHKLDRRHVPVAEIEEELHVLDPPKVDWPEVAKPGGGIEHLRGAGWTG